MMDDAPFVERYSVYSAVEAVRQMTYDTGGLTPAWLKYYDNPFGVTPTGLRTVPARPMPAHC